MSHSQRPSSRFPSSAHQAAHRKWVRRYFGIALVTAALMLVAAPIGRWLSLPWGLTAATLNFLTGTGLMVYTAHRCRKWHETISSEIDSVVGNGLRAADEGLAAIAGRGPSAVG